MAGLIVVKRRASFLSRAILLVLALMSLPGPSWSGEVLFLPSVAVKEEYNDNIFFESSNKTRSFITTVSPGLEYRLRTERGELGLLGRVDVLRYTDESSFNTVASTTAAALPTASLRS